MSPCYGLRFADTMGHSHRALIHSLLARWATVSVLRCWTVIDLGAAVKNGPEIEGKLDERLGFVKWKQSCLPGLQAKQATEGGAVDFNGRVAMETDI